MSAIRLFIGLANPGKDYANTRHNAGGWFIEELAKTLNLSLRHETKFHGLYASNSEFQLLIPTTYMNHSGKAVSACMNYLKIETHEILVAHDEIDLPVGTIKLKYDGGDGGHNGLKDVIAHLHTKQFHRLRIGVGRPLRKEVVDYVLQPPSKADRQIINQRIDDALLVLPLLAKGEISKAMQELHTNNGE